MRLRSLYEKKFKPEIKPIIKNLQDELYQLENKQAKGAKLRRTIRWKLEDEKFSKTFRTCERICETKQDLNLY